MLNKPAQYFLRITTVSMQMGGENQTLWTEFLLLGFSEHPPLRIPLFVGFLIIYLVTIAGNLMVITVIYCDSHLHTPMYFLLTNLSFLDICYSSIMLPGMLANLFLQGTHITLLECLAQVYFVFGVIATEFFLLTIMAYDRYAAICEPLRYAVIMNKPVCLSLSIGAWVGGLTETISHAVLISKFSFCKSHEISHFFCDMLALMNLSCTSTHVIETLTYVLCATVTMPLLAFILASYVSIIAAILKIKSAAGRWKAFSTCASHLTVVILFFGGLLVTYMRPASAYSAMQNKVFSLVFISVGPMCNPIIYTLKNQEFKNALKGRRKGREH